MTEVYKHTALHFYKFLQDFEHILRISCYQTWRYILEVGNQHHVTWNSCATHVIGSNLLCPMTLSLGKILCDNVTIYIYSCMVSCCRLSIVMWWLLGATLCCQGFLRGSTENCLIRLLMWAHAHMHTHTHTHTRTHARTHTHTHTQSWYLLCVFAYRVFVWSLFRQPVLWRDDSVHGLEAPF